MIMRAMGLGFVLWLVVGAAFRFGAAFVCLKLLKEARGDEGEAAIGVALPGLLLNGLLTHEFPRAFPNIDPTLDATFGAWCLLFAASILFMGLSMTKLAPLDERI